MRSWRICTRFISTSLPRANSGPSIPLTSKVLSFDESQSSHRLIEPNDSLKIVDLLSSISRKPVKPSQVEYTEYSDIPKRLLLPIVPTSATPLAINNYVKSLVRFRYEDSLRPVIEESVLTVVENLPDLITRQTYLYITAYFQFHRQFFRISKILETMSSNTNFTNDIDFENVRLGFNRGTVDLTKRVERLEMMKEAGMVVNNNTFYHTYRVLNTHDSKVLALKLMTDRKVDHTPILERSSSCLAQYFTVEEFDNYLKEHGIVDKTLTAFYLNTKIVNHLYNGSVIDAWETAKKYHLDSKCPAKLNITSFLIFAQHFIEKKQVYNCFALYNEFVKTTGVQSRFSLALGLANKYLSQCEAFESWPSLTRAVVNEIQKSREGANLSMVNQLKDLAKVHGIKQFDPYGCTESDTEFLESLLDKLKWKDDEIKFDLAENDEEFIKAANLFVPQRSEIKLNPTQFL
ncbi:hypothetical protein CANARDRAFT_9652 [[Candida] arabinofermentans NRRL YB-2248]|uniref:ATPase expression protein 2, mitochondrial n=1 Tax=[Candida] arabinofermentans NRRL YB-2248 TaxID=983967 RepID=A0A1E4SVA1_9ASCO|nr:hypothetical protein CANARDRAFT_9652 [[Candida] arabinofermentans NRRL YB-2248]